MKGIALATSLGLISVAVASLSIGRAQNNDAPAPPTHNWAAGNPLKIALLKWYAINTTTSFKVRHNPYAVAFDGANVWVSNNGDSSVTKLRANDGANLGTFTVGGAP